MKERDIDEIMQWYDNFTEIVRQLSMSAEEQIQKLEGTVVTDEIASDFSEIGMMMHCQVLQNGIKFVMIPLPKYGVWRCPKCKSIYVYEDGKEAPIMIYRLET